MASDFYGVSGFKQTNQVWKNNSTSKTEKKTNKESKDVVVKSEGDVKISEWKPISGDSPLVPVYKAGYGTVIGEVELSDTAKDYYDKLKSKFKGMDFILVSKDMKSQVAANAASYGNANKPVVLIDEEKLERMATDESFRKKYEGIIAMSQTKLQNAKNSLVSSGANVKNFGMSVTSDGRETFFAAIEKSNTAQNKALEKRKAEKKAAKAEEKKQAEEKRAEKKKEEKKAYADKLSELRKENKTKETDDEKGVEDKEYIDFRANSLEELIGKVSKYAYDNSLRSVLSLEESKIGQNIDFKG